MRSVRTLGFVLLCAVAQGQAPVVTYQGSEAIEGNVIWFNNGTFHSTSFAGDGGSVSLAGAGAAHGMRAWIVPTLVASESVSWGGQAQQEDPFRINIPKVIGPFQAAQAPIAQSGGGSWFAYVKWDNPGLAASLGINAPINQLKIAVITDARKRTDGIPTGSLNSPLNADSTGSQSFNVSNIQYFQNGQTNFRVILGLKQTVQGATRSYVATIDPATGLQTVDWSGSNLVAYGHTSWLNYVTIRAKLKFD